MRSGLIAVRDLKIIGLEQAPAPPLPPAAAPATAPPPAPAPAPPPVKGQSTEAPQERKAAGDQSAVQQKGQ